MLSYLIELVKTGTKFDQQSHDVRVAIVGGNHQRSVVFHVWQVNICPPAYGKRHSMGFRDRMVVSKKSYISKRYSTTSV